ncbi:MAG: transposase [Clostridiales bacterium]|nr:transposase [Clostridiales bacterium]
MRTTYRVMTEQVTIRKAEKYAVSQRALTDKTRDFFMQNFGCCRKVYNLYVDWLYKKLEEAGYDGGEKIPKNKLPEVTEFKKEYAFLKDVDSLGLANAKISFENAISHFNNDCDHKSYTKKALRRDKSGTEKLTFRGLKGIPVFHSKNHRYNSYTTNCQYPNSVNGLKQPTIRLENNKLYLPKLNDGVELIVHRPFPKDAKIGNVTISMESGGQMYASIEYECIIDKNLDLKQAVISGDKEVLENIRILGLDYSQESFYVDSEGRKANYPHFYMETEEKLSRELRKLSHMVMGSSNYNKQLSKVQKTGRKIKNQRNDYINKEALKLSREYDAVAVEDLDLRNLSQSMRLGKKLNDNGFGQFRVVLENKLRDKGSVLVKVDKYYPSTKMCHCCGFKNAEVKLGVRKWPCPNCGVVHDRDENAAINIREEGKRIFADYYKSVLEKEEQAEMRATQRSEYRHKKHK